MSRFRDLQIKLKREQLDALLEDYEAASKQLSNETNDVDRTRLKRQIADIEARAQELEDDIQPLEQPIQAVVQSALTVLVAYHSMIRDRVPQAYRACGLSDPSDDIRLVYETLENAPQGTSTHRPLEKFIAFLVSDRHLDPIAQAALRAYGEHNIDNFLALLADVAQEHLESDPSDPAYLLVKVRLNQQMTTQRKSPYYFVDVWMIPSWQRYDSATGIGCDRLLDSQICQLSELPGLLEQSLTACAEVRDDVEPIIELFLPSDLMNLAIENWRIEGDLEPLYSQYLVVIRSQERLTRRHQRRRPTWQRRWESCNDNNALAILFASGNCQHCNVSASTCESMDDCTRRLAQNRSVFGLRFSLQCGKREPDALFNVIIQQGIPAALWLRQTAPTNYTVEDLDILLEGSWQHLQEQLVQKRIEAMGQSAYLGHHLSLMWENPNRLPPEVDFAS